MKEKRKPVLSTGGEREAATGMSLAITGKEAKMKRLSRRDLLRNSLSAGAAAIMGGPLAMRTAARTVAPTASVVETQYGKAGSAESRCSETLRLFVSRYG